MLYSLIPHVFPLVAEEEMTFVEITCVISDSLSLLHTQTCTHTRTHFLGLTVYPPTHAFSIAAFQTRTWFSHVC